MISREELLSSFNGKKYILIPCPDPNFVNPLISSLHYLGFTWSGEDLPISGGEWSSYREKTVYVISQGSKYDRIQYGDAKFCFNMASYEVIDISNFIVEDCNIDESKWKDVLCL